ncbi:hypothetical protein D3C73_535660 [compost metagenome]
MKCSLSIIGEQLRRQQGQERHQQKTVPQTALIMLRKMATGFLRDNHTGTPFLCFFVR